MIPASAKIKVLPYGWNNRASAEIDGKPMCIGHDYERNEATLEKFILKLVVKTKPRAKIEHNPLSAPPFYLPSSS